jgi:hypothetical protein
MNRILCYKGKPVEKLGRKAMGLKYGNTYNGSRLPKGNGFDVLGAKDQEEKFRGVECISIHEHRMNKTDEEIRCLSNINKAISLYWVMAFCM